MKNPILSRVEGCGLMSGLHEDVFLYLFPPAASISVSGSGAPLYEISIRREDHELLPSDGVETADIPPLFWSGGVINQDWLSIER